jgi:V-type H+-transporting ATPase subunit E
MNPDTARERIQKMKDIIYEEAQDRAKKLREQGAQQYNIEKNKELNQGKDKAIQEYKLKLEQHSVQKRIERSARVGASRLKKMQAKQEAIERVKDEARQVLEKKLENQNVYKDFLKKMIIQGLISLMEKEVAIRCRPQDDQLVEAVMDDAAREFSELLKKETNFDFPCKVRLDGYHKLKENQSKLGGVILSAQQSTILCHNTIDARLDLAFQDSLPDIRRILFPEVIETPTAQ